MRDLSFQPYVKEDEEPQSARIFIRMWQILSSGGVEVGDRKKRKLFKQIIDGFKALKATEQLKVPGPNGEPAVQELVRLRYEGGHIALKEAAFDLLKATWDQYSGKFAASVVDDVLLVDDFLDEVPTVKAPEGTVE